MCMQTTDSDSFKRKKILFHKQKNQDSKVQINLFFTYNFTQVCTKAFQMSGYSYKVSMLGRLDGQSSLPE